MKKKNSDDITYMSSLQQNALELLKREKSLKGAPSSQKELIHKWKLIFHSKQQQLQSGYQQAPVTQQSMNEFQINMGKKIEEDQQGWHWYKNLIIPTIKIHQQEGLEGLKYPSSSKLQVTALSFKKINNHTILPVLISGNLTQSIQQGRAVFKGLKFEETCFMSKSSFFVMTLIFHIDDQIQAVYLSPRIQIEARKKYWQDRQTMMEIFDPFLPKLLSMEHKEGKPNLSVLQKVKGTDFEPILNYFSNITIRHKIRHPLFLFLKFPQAIKLYTNNTKIDPSMSDKQKMVELQKQFYNSIKNPNSDIPKEQKALIIKLSKVQSKFHLDIIQKNVNRYMQGLECSAIAYTQDPDEELPEVFTEFCYNSLSNESYTQAYSLIINIQFQSQMGGVDLYDKSKDSDEDELETNHSKKKDLEDGQEENKNQDIIVKKRQVDNLNTVIDVQKQIQKYRQQNKGKQFYVVQVRKTDFNLTVTNLEPKGTSVTNEKPQIKQMNLENESKTLPESAKNMPSSENLRPQEPTQAGENQFLKQRLTMQVQNEPNLNRFVIEQQQKLNSFSTPNFYPNTYPYSFNHQFKQPFPHNYCDPLLNPQLVNQGEPQFRNNSYLNYAPYPNFTNTINNNNNNTNNYPRPDMMIYHQNPGMMTHQNQQFMNQNLSVNYPPTYNYPINQQQQQQYI